MARINIRRIVMSLVVGVVVTVLVAWYRPIDMSPAMVNGYPDLGAKEFGQEPWPISVPAEWPRTATISQRYRNRMSDTVLYCDYFNFGMREGSGPIAETMHDVDVVRSGWPCRAMAQYEAQSGLGRARTQLDVGLIRSGLPLPRPLRSFRLGTTTPLPLMPLWPGFLVNTLFYSAMAFSSLAGFSLLKCRRRARRGLCIQCAYPIAGLNACPECGRLVPGGAQSPLGSGGSRVLKAKTGDFAA